MSQAPTNSRPPIPSRPPTHAEAVEIVMRCLTSECRHSCIAHWSGLCGDAFAKRVEAEARKRYEGKS